MNARTLIDDVWAHLVDSLRFEDDPEFRLEMDRLIKRTMALVGMLGPFAVLLYVGGQVGILGKDLVTSYRGHAPGTVMVIWDKLAMIVTFVALLQLRRLLPAGRPIYGRIAFAIGTVIVIAAITLDDIGAGTLEFTPAYVTLLILFLAGAVPMPPFQMLFSAASVMILGFLTSDTLVPIIGFPELELTGDHAVFLAVVAVIATGASSLLYNVRHEEYRARKSVEVLSHQLVDKNLALEHTMQDLRATQDRLIYTERMASLRRFSMGVAHEMRNRLNFILNFAGLSIDLLEESEGGTSTQSDSHDLRENLQRIESHALRADQIVKSLIAHSQRSSSLPSHVNLNRLIEELTSDLARRYEPAQTGISVNRQLELNTDVGEIQAFAADLTVALENVMDNAFRAVIDRASAEEAGYEPTIEVTTTRRDDVVRIEIRDNGIGMKDAGSGIIFEPFYTTRSAGAGTGLGLTASYAAITEGHGGTINVSSEPGKGSVFTIELGKLPESPTLAPATG